MNCEFCNKVSKLTIKVCDNGSKCECGELWKADDRVVCSVGCYNKNAYWEIYKDEGKMFLSVEDECCGCGQNIIFDVPVKVLHS